MTDRPLKSGKPQEMGCQSALPLMTDLVKKLIQMKVIDLNDRYHGDRLIQRDSLIPAFIAASKFHFVQVRKKVCDIYCKGKLPFLIRIGHQ